MQNSDSNQHARPVKDRLPEKYSQKMKERKEKTEKRIRPNKRAERVETSESELDVSGPITMDDSDSDMVIEAQSDSGDRDVSLKIGDLKQGDYMLL